jgi:hypothetical protein
MRWSVSAPSMARWATGCIEPSGIFSSAILAPEEMGARLTSVRAVAVMA